MSVYTSVLQYLGSPYRQHRCADISGDPYSHGVQDPHEGFCCSGLVRRAAYDVGIMLPPDLMHSWQMHDQLPIGDGSPGDIIILSRLGVRVTHVGIVLPDNKIIHSCKKEKRVIISSMDEILSMYPPKLTEPRRRFSTNPIGYRRLAKI